MKRDSGSASVDSRRFSADAESCLFTILPALQGTTKSRLADWTSNRIEGLEAIGDFRSTPLFESDHEIQIEMPVGHAKQVEVLAQDGCGVIRFQSDNARPTAILKTGLERAVRKLKQEILCMERVCDEQV